MPPLPALDQLRPERFETPPVLKRLAEANRQLGELKGVAAALPESILVRTFGLLEARASSAIAEIVVTPDELFRQATFPDEPGSPAAKAVARCERALAAGFAGLSENRHLTSALIARLQAALVGDQEGFRRREATTVRDGTGGTFDTPPPAAIPGLMAAFERFASGAKTFAADPLVRMAVQHHLFESIHPFAEGNGRTGRIVNLLFLVQERLLAAPTLFLSRPLERTKTDYYCLLQAVREDDAWEEWVVYLLTAVAAAAREGVGMAHAIRELRHDLGLRLHARYRFYSQALLDNLFHHPYTRIALVERDLDVSRLTATRYLEELTAGGFLEKRKVGRSSYYVNRSLSELLMRGPG